MMVFAEVELRRGVETQETIDLLKWHSSRCKDVCVSGWKRAEEESGPSSGKNYFVQDGLG